MGIVNILADIIGYVDQYMDIIRLVVVIIVTAIIFGIILKLLKRYLLKKVRRNKQIANVLVFLDLLKFVFVVFLVIIVFSAYHGSWGDIGFLAGLLTIALGWALQKPISGVVAWLILITRRPFIIGDRVIISNIKGDITNISLTHIFLDEVGGTIDGEEQSGRTIMLPTSIIFEQEVVNYTEKNEYILDEVTTAITYESNLEKAEKIISDAVGKIMTPLWDKFPKRIPQEPHIRLRFRDSGINVTVRYYSLTTRRNAIATDIVREIFKRIREAKDVAIAYPHAEVLLREETQR
jgi:small-conductance mechanosensitive channel